MSCVGPWLSANTGLFLSLEVSSTPFSPDAAAATPLLPPVFLGAVLETLCCLEVTVELRDHTGKGGK